MIPSSTLIQLASVPDNSQILIVPSAPLVVCNIAQSVGALVGVSRGKTDEESAVGRPGSFTNSLRVSGQELYFERILDVDDLDDEFAIDSRRLSDRFDEKARRKGRN